MLPLQASGSLRITTNSHAECKRRLRSSLSLRYLRKPADICSVTFGSLREIVGTFSEIPVMRREKISCVWLSKRLKKLTLYQDAFHMHICLHIATRHNSLQGWNILIKEHFAKNAHQTKRVNRNRKLMCTDRIKCFGLINVPFSLSVLRSIWHEEVMVEYY